MSERPFDDLSTEGTNYTILLPIEYTESFYHVLSKCKLKTHQGIPIDEEPASDFQR